METLSFTLGVLSVIIVAFVAVLVWGIVKVVKQQKQISSTKMEIETLHRYINESLSNAHNRLNEMDRNAYEHLREYKREIDDRFKESQRDLDKRISEIYQLIEQNSDRTSMMPNQVMEMCKSYTDSRIDKLLEKTNKKQIIKG